ncbi:mobilization protein [Rhizobium sp. SL42]|uniref:mobilization protein n=1 Tax=Rhizobium sp. SL42 TaxID=2806346 RepID=UPI001F16F35B|nr:mobilization protein [Rhizobium sp. SL42]UJW73532.1 mobilization protein [Rhizobium sp. SL42]
MARRAIRERLEQLEARRQVLVARLAKQERARDTRRKILLGALVLQRLHTNSKAEFSQHLGEWLRAELPGFLIRDGDRELFDDILAPAPMPREISERSPE